MNDKNNVSQEALGADSDSRLKRTTIEDVRRYAKQDLSLCLHFLEAIYRDESTLNAISDYLHGRLMNELHRKELQKQKDLDLSK